MHSDWMRPSVLMPVRRYRTVKRQAVVHSPACSRRLQLSYAWHTVLRWCSDVWGRKPFLLMYIVGQALGMLGLTLSPSLSTMTLGLILASLTPCQFVLYIILVDITQHTHISIANKFGSYFALFGALALCSFPIGVLAPMWVSETKNPTETSPTNTRATASPCACPVRPSPPKSSLRWSCSKWGLFRERQPVKRQAQLLFLCFLSCSRRVTVW